MIQFYVSNKQITVSQIQKTLGHIMRRLQVSQDHRLTYRDLAQMAGTSERTMAEWMRGATSPKAMNGLLNLMSALKADDAIQVLALWRETATQDSTSVDKAQEIQK
jgi:transcriptional regulator with XRE-family HTH domain